MPPMRRAALSLLAPLLMIPAPALAQDALERSVGYDLYAAGFHVAEVQATFGVGPHFYEVRVDYHTTGLVSLFRHGHQVNTVTGTWDTGRPQPRHYQAIGVWQGQDRVTLIDYQHGQPLIRSLIPPQEAEREPVPLPLQQNTVDMLSTLALLVRRVADTGHCEASVHTFDGNRAGEISAHTAGEEILAPTSFSIFSGKALRCDFLHQTLAGFLLEDSSAYDRRPLHGSVWLARLAPGEPPLPVRIDVETRWFGEATTYLTQFGQIPPTEIAAH
jgi:hypothetical protein